MLLETKPYFNNKTDYRTSRRCFTVCLFFAFLFSHLLTTAVAVATYYYVDDVNGSDSNDGSITEPWKTIARAYPNINDYPKVQSGDTVYLRNGNYGTFSLNNYTNTNWITYKAATGHSPVFTNIYIHNTTQNNVYLKFDGIDVEIPDPGYDQNNPPWILLYGLDVHMANYVYISNCIFRGAIKPLVGNMVSFYSSNNITMTNCEVTSCQNPIYVNTCNNALISWNYIHNYMGSGIRLYGGLNVTGQQIIGNHITDVNWSYNEPFFPPDTLYISNTQYPGAGSWNESNLVIGDTIYQNSITQQAGIVKNILWNGTNYVIYVAITTGNSERWDFGGSYGVYCQRSGQFFFISSRGGGHHDGSALAIRTSNTTISKNIIHNIPGQGIYFYPEGTMSYSNMVVQNNLTYDVSNSNGFNRLNGPTLIRNNTFIGCVNISGHLDRSNLPQRYVRTGSVSFNSGFRGTGVEFYNNIWVGPYPLPDPLDTNNKYDENYNIYWSHPVGSNYKGTGKGTRTKIVSWREDSPNLSPRGWPNFFEDIGYNTGNYSGHTGINVCTTGSGPYDYDYAIDGVTPFFIHPSFMFNRDPSKTAFGSDIGKIFEFHLTAGSPAINFGNASKQPSDSLGTIGPDGFIRDDGPERNSGHHSAGCYEYVGCPPIAVADGNQFILDLDFDGNEPVILDGSGSTVPCGSIISYTWTEYKNGNKLWEEINSIPTLIKTLPVGKHSITLTVKNDINQTDTDSIEITVMGLFGYYKFNEGSGTLASDSAGISTAGQLINGPTWTAQGEIAFDGDNDAVEITTANLEVNSGTIALWAYAEDFSKRRHFLFGETTQNWNNRIQLYCNELGLLCMGLGNNPDDIQILNLNSNEWYHIALVWDGMSYVVYVDGIQEATGSYSGLSSLQTYADIGNNGNRSSRKEGFDGLIDDVQMYNRPLDANEIMGLALGFLPIDNKTVAEGESLSFTVRTKSGVVTEISDENLPGVPSLISNIFSWTPDYDDAGTYQVTFSSPHISDGNYEDFETINISVLDTQQFDPIGHWPFDEMSGNFAFDISTSGNTGHLLNGLAWDSGVINGAIAFSVPNDSVQIRTTGFNPSSGTIAMYVYIEGFTLSRHYLFGHAVNTDVGPTNRIQLYIRYGTLCLGLGDSHETVINIDRLQIHQWYHIAMIWSWGNYNVYINGLPANSGSYSGLTGFTGNAKIGNNGINNDKAFNGKIDDVYIYNRALTAAEISDLAQQAN